jgi:DNA-directed RNA polymerase subunit RPC12/RpoP
MRPRPKPAQNTILRAGGTGDGSVGPESRAGLPCSLRSPDGPTPAHLLETEFFEGELMVWKPRAPAMSKEAMRQESERLVREAMARNVTITQGKTRLDVKCSKCGAPNRVSAEVDHGRVEYACKECGHKQRTL